MLSVADKHDKSKPSPNSNSEHRLKQDQGFCRICNTLVSSNFRHVQEHRRGRRHQFLLPECIRITGFSKGHDLELLYNYFSMFGEISYEHVNGEEGVIEVTYKDKNVVSEVVHRRHEFFGVPLHISFDNPSKLQTLKSSLKAKSQVEKRNPALKPNLETSDDRLEEENLNSLMLTQNSDGTSSTATTTSTAVDILQSDSSSSTKSLSYMTSAKTKKSTKEVKLNLPGSKKTYFMRKLVSGENRVHVLAECLQDFKQNFETDWDVVVKDLGRVLSPGFSVSKNRPIKIFPLSTSSLTFEEDVLTLHVNDIKDFSEEQELEILKKLLDCISVSRQFKDTKLLTVSLPIPNMIECVHRMSSIVCHVIIRNMLPVYQCSMIDYHMKLSNKVVHLVLLIQFWAECYDLKKIEGFSTYTICLLIIFFLQQAPFNRSEPFYKFKTANKVNGWPCNFKSVKSRSSEDYLKNVYNSVILKEFFKFYSNFDYISNVVCPFYGQSLLKESFLDLKNLPFYYARYKNLCSKSSSSCIDMTSGLCVQDPIEHNKNITAGVSLQSAAYFAEICNRTLGFLENADYGQTGFTEAILNADIPPKTNFWFLIRKSSADLGDEVWQPLLIKIVNNVLKNVLNCSVVNKFADHFHCECYGKLDIWQNRFEVFKSNYETFSKLSFINRETEITKHVVSYLTKSSCVAFSVHLIFQKSSFEAKVVTEDKGHCDDYEHLNSFLRLNLPKFIEEAEADLIKKKTVPPRAKEENSVKDALSTQEKDGDDLTSVEELKSARQTPKKEIRCSQMLNVFANVCQTLLDSATKTTEQLLETPERTTDLQQSNLVTMRNQSATQNNSLLESVKQTVDEITKNIEPSELQDLEANQTNTQTAACEQKSDAVVPEVIKSNQTQESSKQKFEKNTNNSETQPKSDCLINVSDEGPEVLESTDDLKQPTDSDTKQAEMQDKDVFESVKERTDEVAETLELSTDQLKQKDYETSENRTETKESDKLSKNIEIDTNQSVKETTEEMTKCLELMTTGLKQNYAETNDDLAETEELTRALYTSENCKQPTAKTRTSRSERQLGSVQRTADEVTHSEPSKQQNLETDQTETKECELNIHEVPQAIESNQKEKRKSSKPNLETNTEHMTKHFVKKRTDEVTGTKVVTDKMVQKKSETNEDNTETKESHELPMNIEIDTDQHKLALGCVKNVTEEVTTGLELTSTILKQKNVETCNSHAEIVELTEALASIYNLKQPTAETEKNYSEMQILKIKHVKIDTKHFDIQQKFTLDSAKESTEEVKRGQELTTNVKQTNTEHMTKHYVKKRTDEVTGTPKLVTDKMVQNNSETNEDNTETKESNELPMNIEIDTDQHKSALGCVKNVTEEVTTGLELTSTSLKQKNVETCNFRTEIVELTEALASIYNLKQPTAETEKNYSEMQIPKTKHVKIDTKHFDIQQKFTLDSAKESTEEVKRGQELTTNVKQTNTEHMTKHYVKKRTDEVTGTPKLVTDKMVQNNSETNEDNTETKESNELPMNIEIHTDQHKLALGCVKNVTEEVTTGLELTSTSLKQKNVETCNFRTEIVELTEALASIYNLKQPTAETEKNYSEMQIPKTKHVKIDTKHFDIQQKFTLDSAKESTEEVKRGQELTTNVKQTNTEHMTKHYVKKRTDEVTGTPKIVTDKMVQNNSETNEDNTETKESNELPMNIEIDTDQHKLALGCVKNVTEEVTTGLEPTSTSLKPTNVETSNSHAEIVELAEALASIYNLKEPTAETEKSYSKMLIPKIKHVKIDTKHFDIQQKFTLDSAKESTEEVKKGQELATNVKQEKVEKSDSPSETEQLTRSMDSTEPTAQTKTTHSAMQHKSLLESVKRTVDEVTQSEPSKQPNLETDQTVTETPKLVTDKMVQKSSETNEDNTETKESNELPMNIEIDTDQHKLGLGCVKNVTEEVTTGLEPTSTSLKPTNVETSNSHAEIVELTEALASIYNLKQPTAETEKSYSKMQIPKIKHVKIDTKHFDIQQKFTLDSAKESTEEVKKGQELTTNVKQEKVEKSDSTSETEQLTRSMDSTEPTAQTKSTHSAMQHKSLLESVKMTVDEVTQSEPSKQPNLESDQTVTETPKLVTDKMVQKSSETNEDNTETKESNELPMNIEIDTDQHKLALGCVKNVTEEVTTGLEPTSTSLKPTNVETSNSHTEIVELTEALDLTDNLKQPTAETEKNDSRHGKIDTKHFDIQRKFTLNSAKESTEEVKRGQELTTNAKQKKCEKSHTGTKQLTRSMDATEPAAQTKTTHSAMQHKSRVDEVTNRKKTSQQHNLVTNDTGNKQHEETTDQVSKANESNQTNKRKRSEHKSVLESVKKRSGEETRTLQLGRDKFVQKYSVNEVKYSKAKESKSNESKFKTNIKLPEMEPKSVLDCLKNLNKEVCETKTNHSEIQRTICLESINKTTGKMTKNVRLPSKVNNTQTKEHVENTEEATTVTKPTCQLKQQTTGINKTKHSKIQHKALLHSVKRRTDEVTRTLELGADSTEPKTDKLLKPEKFGPGKKRRMRRKAKIFAETKRQKLLSVDAVQESRELERRRLALKQKNKCRRCEDANGSPESKLRKYEESFMKEVEEKINEAKKIAAEETFKKVWQKLNEVRRGSSAAPAAVTPQMSAAVNYFVTNLNVGVPQCSRETLVVPAGKREVAQLGGSGDHSGLKLKEDVNLDELRECNKIQLSDVAVPTNLPTDLHTDQVNLGKVAVITRCKLALKFLSKQRNISCESGRFILEKEHKSEKPRYASPLRRGGRFSFNDGSKVQGRAFTETFKELLHYLKTNGVSSKLYPCRECYKSDLRVCVDAETQCDDTNVNCDIGIQVDTEDLLSHAQTVSQFNLFQEVSDATDGLNNKESPTPSAFIKIAEFPSCDKINYDAFDFCEDDEIQDILDQLKEIEEEEEREESNECCY